VSEVGRMAKKRVYVARRVLGILAQLTSSGDSELAGIGTLGDTCLLHS